MCLIELHDLMIMCHCRCGAVRQLTNPFGFSSHDIGMAADRDEGGASDHDGVPRTGRRPPRSKDAVLEIELTRNPLARTGILEGSSRDGQSEQMAEMAQQIETMSYKLESLTALSQNLAADVQALQGFGSARTDADSKSSLSRPRSRSVSVRLQQPSSLVALALPTEDRPSHSNSTNTASTMSTAARTPSLWREVLTDDAAQEVYYFNDETEDSLWDPPKDFILLLDGAFLKLTTDEGDDWVYVKWVSRISDRYRAAGVVSIVCVRVVQASRWWTIGGSKSRKLWP
jgi:hypothetical protein